VPLLVFVLLLPLAILVLMPLILVQRYRTGTARRQARAWVTTVSLAGLLLSAAFLLAGAAVTAIWIPGAFRAALAGVVLGCALGAVGLALTRWEFTARSLHYTPNRWLILVITLMVSARLLYGLWRSWAMARAGFTGASLVAGFGVTESLAAGAIVLGYYLFYTAGLRWRIRLWQRRALRVM
jgi:glucose-6-phosphate-specific signal transduction histidine kinase